MSGLAAMGGFQHDGWWRTTRPAGAVRRHLPVPAKIKTLDGVLQGGRQPLGSTYVSLTHGTRNALPNGFWMHDGLLEVWLRLLALHIEDPVESGTLATTIRDQWLLASRGYFGGCCPHGMEEATATLEGTALVRAAVLSLLKALSQGGDWIAKDRLNLMGIGGFTRDFETKRFTEISEAFLDLMDGKIMDKNLYPGSSASSEPKA
jgi:hypothetical protein